MNTQEKVDYIINWIEMYRRDNHIESLVVGVSGGIDSAVVSTLCGLTGAPTFVVSMPIKQKIEQHALSIDHSEKLSERFTNVTHIKKDLSKIFNEFEDKFDDMKNDLAFANTRARIRMTALYQIAQFNNGIVVGTGNKVEDFGVGFFTKYGDGGVDISPIGDCMKTDVWHMGRLLGVSEEIISAAPTDGLWDDGRSDEEQLGMTYVDLEMAMAGMGPVGNVEKYHDIKRKNLHKMNPIPVCKVN
jgi:NAD+ synthase